MRGLYPPANREPSAAVAYFLRTAVAGSALSAPAIADDHTGDAAALAQAARRGFNQSFDSPAEEHRAGDRKGAGPIPGFRRFQE